MKREAEGGKPEEPFKWDYFIDELSAKQAKDMSDAEKGVYEEHKTSESLVHKWLEKYQGDKEVEAVLARLKAIGEQVLKPKDQSIEHIKCADVPEGLDEDTYILVFRKLHQIIRYEIYSIMNKYGGTSAAPETQKA